MNFSLIKESLSSQPAFRLKQVQKAIFVDFIDNWSQATVLPLALRNELNEKAPLGLKAKMSVGNSSVKALVELEDSEKIETVLMRHRDGRQTVCVSSQVGCPLGCVFCATGKLGLKRDLSRDEIINQVLLFNRFLKPEGKRVDHVVFMGMGEPLLNLGMVLSAINILHDPDYFNLSARHISASTSGIIPGIKRLTQEPLPINLAISLHAPTQDKRARLMPIARQYHLTELLSAVDNYIENKNRQVMFEYALIKDVNDSQEDALALARLMNRPLYFLNLIQINQVDGFKAPDNSRLEAFKNVLRREKINFSERYRLGREIKGACGQLAGE